MSLQKKTLVRGDVLRSILSTSDHEVKWIRFDGEKWLDTVTISAAMARAIAGGTPHEGRVRSGRVITLRQLPELDPRSNGHGGEYWDGRACIRFHTDMLASRPLPIRQRQQVDLWDQMLHRDPAPSSWQRSKV